MAVYNEERYLPFSLPSITDPIFDEVVIVLDRCIDNSEKLIREVMDERVVLIHKKVQEWAEPCAEAKNVGCAEAKGDLLMITDADIILDIDAVKRAIEILEDEEIDAVIFTYRQYSQFGNIFSRLKDWWMNCLWYLIRESGFQPTRSGIFMIRKEFAVIPDLSSEYDHLQRTLRTRVIQTKTKHLRPKRSRQDQIARGKARANMPQYSLLKIVIMSLLKLEPFIIYGFLKEKHARAVTYNETMP